MLIRTLIRIQKKHSIKATDCQQNSELSVSTRQTIAPTFMVLFMGLIVWRVLTDNSEFCWQISGGPLLL